MAEDSRNKIIVADDESYMRRLTGMMIENEIPGFELEFFEDGTSLEKRLNNGIANVRLIVTDNSMPGINGSELIKKYATELRQKKIPMILYYGGHEEIGQEAVRNGAFGYLLKPCDLHIFTGKLIDALNHPHYQLEF